MADQPLGKDSGHLAGTALRDLYCVLAHDTTVVHLSSSVTLLTGHTPDTLIGRRLLPLVHDDDACVFDDELQKAAAIPGLIFRFHARISTAFPAPSHAAFELRGHFDKNIPSVHHGVFTLVARPAFATRSTIFDSFLGLKMEQFVLLRQLMFLRAEEAAAEVAASSHNNHHDNNDDDMTIEKSSTTSATTDSIMMSTTSHISGFAVRAQHAVIGQRPGVIAKNALLVGDAGILFAPRDAADALSPPSSRRGKRRTSARSHGGKTELICSSCNTTSAPEWRRGPDGPKTLCNACGLRYSKSRHRPISDASEADDCALRSLECVRELASRGGDDDDDDNDAEGEYVIETDDESPP